MELYMDSSSINVIDTVSAPVSKSRLAHYYFSIGHESANIKYFI